MTTRTPFLFALCIALLVGLLAEIAVLVGPAVANKDPVTPQQLQAYEEVFMEQVKKGDLLFHGDDATAKQMDVVLSTTGWACAMCHPFASDTHPHAFPKFQVSMNNDRIETEYIMWGRKEVYAQSPEDSSLSQPEILRPRIADRIGPY